MADFEVVQALPGRVTTPKLKCSYFQQAWVFDRLDLDVTKMGSQSRTHYPTPVKAMKWRLLALDKLSRLLTLRN